MPFTNYIQKGKWARKDLLQVNTTNILSITVEYPDYSEYPVDGLHHSKP